MVAQNAITLIYPKFEPSAVVYVAIQLRSYTTVCFRIVINECHHFFAYFLAAILRQYHHIVGFYVFSYIVFKQYPKTGNGNQLVAVKYTYAMVVVVFHLFQSRFEYTALRLGIEQFEKRENEVKGGGRY